MKSIKRILKLAAASAAMVVLAGCVGERVEVPPVNVGKIMDTGGYQEGIKSPSTFRLDSCFISACQKLVLLDVSDFEESETYSLFMPQDKLELTYTLGVTIAPKPSSRDELFGMLSPQRLDEHTMQIPVRKGYDTYVKPVIARESRNFLSEYSIMEIASNRQEIANALTAHLKESISENTPFYAKMVNLADTKFPDIITNAQEQAAERRERIQQVEAEREVNRVELEKKLEEAEAKRAISVENAEAEAEVNRIMAESMTPEYVQYRRLQALEAIANSDNTKFVPTDLLNGLAGEVMIGNQAR